MTKPIEQITSAFNQGRPVFMPYFTLGYPDYETSLDVVQSCVEAGADLMELGIPFSDPLADGPTIQHSTQVALQGGMTVARCLSAVQELRGRGLKIPFLLMGYYNPILAFGVARFVKEARAVGVNGFIIPDLPPDEAAELEELCRQNGLGLIYLLTPNSSAERIRLITKRSTGFVYLVSVIGITGARTTLPPHLRGFIQRVRAMSKSPLAVGFGISTPEQAHAVGQFADGVIVGSALIKAASQAMDPPLAAANFVREMCKAITGVQ